MTDAISNFKKEAGKLSKINKLTESTDELVKQVREETEALSETSKKISELKKQVTADCKTLSEFTKREETARRQLLENIHAQVVKDTTQTVENLTAPLTKINDALKITTRTLSAIVEDEKKFQNEFVGKLKNYVDKNTADNAETRRKIAMDLSAYFTMQENLQSTAQANLLAQIEKLLEKQRQSMSYEIGGVKRELEDKLSQQSANLDKQITALEKSVVAISANLQTVSYDITVLKNKRGIFLSLKKFFIFGVDKRK
ncbi:MAG: hypothetical protein IJS81_10760 [Selenomonadaceae bacterium]|nr:hypothetical protein [Selenomonadaceae bacterium]